MNRTQTDRSKQVAHQQVTLSFADFSDPAKLAEVPNDETVALRLGEEQTIEAYNRQYTVRTTELDLVVPGTDVPMVPIHAYTLTEYERMVERERQHSSDHGEQLPAAWFVPDMGERGGVELPVVADGNGAPPVVIEMTAGRVKQFLGYIFHEATHAAGGFEFQAYWQESLAQHQMGLTDVLRDKVDIMKHIIANYSDLDVANAQDEFLAIANDDETSRYWDHLATTITLPEIDIPPDEL